MAAPEGTKPRVVLIGVDGSHCAEHAYDWYMEALHRPENEVMVVQVLEVHHTHVFQSAGMFITQEVWQAQIEKAKDAAKGVESKYLAKFEEKQVNGKYIFEVGKPGERICQVAAEEGAELIVVGTRGHGKLRRTVLGSISDYVVHHAHCPVVTVRKDAHHHHHHHHHKDGHH